jgi:DNA-binding PadR family transcriptional regulator
VTPNGPTSTSFAILGLLAVRPSTAYELAQQMERSLRHFWPRAESRVYEEPKRLVRLGYARATAQRVGKRSKTLYTITAKGKLALARWLDEQATTAAPQLEFESLLKLFFSEHGSKAGALAQIEAIRTWALERTAQNIRIPRSYLDGDVPFPERLAQIVVVGRFLTDFTDMVDAWSEWATVIVDEWPDPPAGAEPDWSTIRAVAQRPLPRAVAADGASHPVR